MPNPPRRPASAPLPQPAPGIALPPARGKKSFFWGGGGRHRLIFQPDGSSRVLGRSRSQPGLHPRCVSGWVQLGPTAGVWGGGQKPPLGARLEEPREAVGRPQRTCWGGWDTPLSQGAFPTPSTARAAPAQVGELSPRRGPPARQGGSRSGAKVFLGECGGEVGAEADPDEPGRPARGCCTRIPQRVGTPDRPPRVPGVGVMATIPL